MNTTEGFCQQKYRPYITPQENWTSFCCTLLWTASIAQRAIPISHALRKGVSLGR